MAKAVARLPGSRETRLTSLWSISGVPTGRQRDPLRKACGAVSAETQKSPPAAAPDGGRRQSQPAEAERGKAGKRRR
ncbi:Hypothetical protein SMAX5B_004346, partial [Scophthalmus maximus]